MKASDPPYRISEEIEILKLGADPLDNTYIEAVELLRNGDWLIIHKERETWQ